VPFLRVIRDRHGYETTYLLHWFREGGQQRSRVLYVFRTHGGVRVGRDPLEPDTLRQIEAQNPGVEFDWKLIREQKQLVESVEPRRRRRRDSDESAPSEPTAVTAPVSVAPVASVPAAVASPPVPSVVEGATPTEQIAYLSAWYPRVLERIPRRTSDPARQEALRALAERINAAEWPDDDQRAVRLQHASEALERLSRVFARRRRRSRKSSHPRADTAKEPAGAAIPEGGDRDE
jgi:hypothetical protein